MTTGINEHGIVEEQRKEPTLPDRASVSKYIEEREKMVTRLRQSDGQLR
jgi:hypothetical protein